MISAKGYAAHNQDAALELYSFERKEPGDYDVLIDIIYCGICHADVHQTKNEYGNTKYPLVPGHEIIGRIRSIGEKVSKFKEDELVGVGYFILSCGHCPSCITQEQQFCDNGITPTQNGKLSDGTFTKGGYSDCIVVNENYVLSVPETLNHPGAAPLLCAGITTYSSLTHNKVGKGHKVAILGLGGLGHMAVKFAASFGAEVTVLSSSAAKEDDAQRLGAHHFVNTYDKEQFASLANHFDFIVDTVSAKHDYNTYLNLLKKDGTMILLGVPPEPSTLHAHALTGKRRKITGSFIGGIEETQEMLYYCAKHKITADVELIRPDEINNAFERMVKGDVKYRFTIDMQKL